VRYDGDDDKNSSAMPSNGFPDLVRCGGTGRDVPVVVVDDDAFDVAALVAVCDPVGGGADTGAGTGRGLLGY